MDSNRHSQLELTGVDDQSQHQEHQDHHQEQQQQQFCTSLHVDVATGADSLTLAQSADWGQLTHSGPIQFVRIVGANGEELQMLATDYHTLQSQQVTLLAQDTGTTESIQFSQLTACVPSAVPEIDHHQQQEDQELDVKAEQLECTPLNRLDHCPVNSLPETVQCVDDICTSSLPVNASSHHHHHQLMPVSLLDHQQQQQHVDLSSERLSNSAVVRTQSQPAAVNLSSIAVPFLNDANRHDLEVQYFADVYRRLAVIAAGGDGGALEDSGVAGAARANSVVMRRRLKHYSICDGDLYYGTKRPRKVLLDRCRQEEILRSAHISQAGIHNGIRRMSAEIEFHWRGIHSDIVRTVRQCATCFETQTLHSSVPHTAGLSPEADPEKPVFDTPSSSLSSAIPSQVAQSNCRLEQQKSGSEESVLSRSGDHLTSTQPSFRQPRSRAELQLHRATRVWKKVEARVLGPFCRTSSGCEYLATVADPQCQWLQARPCPANDRFSTLIQLLYTCFCQLGVAQCTLIDVSEQQFIAMHSRFKEKLARMQEIVCNAVQSAKENCFVFSLQSSASSSCIWAAEMLERYVSQNGTRWDTELDSFLLAHHITVSPELGHSPFDVMFGRNCDGSVSEHDRECCAILEEEKALDVPIKPRRRLGSSMMKCRHCGETYTSKISFRIHQRRHTEQARRSGEVDGQEAVRGVSSAGGSAQAAAGRRLLRRALRDNQLKHGNRRTNVHLCQPRPGWSQESLSDSNNKTNRTTSVPQTQDQPLNSNNINNNNIDSGDGNTNHTATTTTAAADVEEDDDQTRVTMSTVSRVRALLASARCQAHAAVTRRRGKYTRYGDAMRHEIAAYAVRHGCRRACQHFSRVLGGRSVATSSVRNFVRSHRLLTQQLRMEIGQYALQHGVQQAALLYGQQLQSTLKLGVVRRYMREYRTQQQQQGAEHQNDNNTVQSQPSTSHLTPGVIVSTHATDLSSTSLHSSSHLAPNANLSTASLQPSVAPLSPPTSTTCFSTGENYVDSAPLLAVDVPSVAVDSAHSVSHDHTLYTVFTENTDNSSAVSSGGGDGVSELVPTQLTTDSQLYQPIAPPSGDQLMYQRGGHHSSHRLQETQPPELVFMEAPVAVLSEKEQQLSQHFVVVTQPSTEPSADMAVVIDQSSAGCYSRTPSSLTTEAADDAVEGRNQAVRYNRTSGRLAARTANSSHQLLHQFQEVTPSTDTDSINQQQRVTVLVHATSDVTAADPIPSTLESVSTVMVAPSSVERMNSLDPPRQRRDSNGVCDDDGSDGDEDEEYGSVAKRRGRKLSQRGGRRKRGGGRGCHRGYYSAYSPELRAEVGRYAHEHGTIAARRYFGQRLGSMLPDSTVRGLRDKYAAKLRLAEAAAAAAASSSNSPRGDEAEASTGEDISSTKPPPPPGTAVITALGFGQRGRPIRLGKYEQLVAECVRRLATESDEPVSDFVCIASARQVLLQYEPHLLEEHGGPIRLSTSWAKSFIKRMGFNSSAHRQQRQSQQLPISTPEGASHNSI